MEKFGLGINAFGQYLLAAQHASERKEMFNARHLKDADGDPDGGVSWGTGFNIAWHSGCPLERANGALPENVIGAALDRLEHLQNSRYSSPYYGQAIGFLKDALAALEERVIEVK